MSFPANRLSLQATLALAAGAFSLLVLTGVAVAADLTIRMAVERSVYEASQRAATDWIASMTDARPSPPVTTSDVDLLQLVDSSGNVVAASRAAAGLPRLSLYWPSSDNRIEHRRACSPSGCLMFTAVRPSPQEEQVLWGGESHVVYAGQEQPAILGTYRLELYLALAVLTASTLAMGAAWALLGLALRPVEAMRRRMAEVTVTDLSMRVPVPPGRDAVARLAHTVNDTLARLESTVDQQRRFSSMVSHELRTPLTGVRTELEEALMYRDVDPHESIGRALTALDRCHGIVEEMLILARVRTAPRRHERVNLTELARDEVAARKAPIRIHAEEDVMVYGNAVQLREVLLNLLVNAERHADSLVEVSVTRAEEQAIVTVLDDGPGIAETERERVFQPFVRLDDARRRDPQGSGLGLAISRAIAESHDGSLTIGDSPRGALFILRIPLANAL
ncbi:HAMP domain-containing sensor histidine kinase [Nonomuraea aridisoli]|uniref:histidine kinase n=1 Tax=Nonomuraea aridisoli TaxID=2070368 RepID=A0A2W2EL33_9ACTN|nr:HAMP domain-containing sensor histidine kinase [Nonomuraea aridisoli]PZG17365.1 two-component sensor histidine kinase [Nonomuraea aridisoli]